MIRNRHLHLALLSAGVLALAGCGTGGTMGSGSPAPKMDAQEDPFWESRLEPHARNHMQGRSEAEKKLTLRSLFKSDADSNTGTSVNRYLWNASLDVLNFLPVETVDPFTGVISTGYGTPPGGSRAYRATVYISDPALDARSLKLALQSKGGGPVSAEITAQVEEAILTRARQLRARDSKL